MKAIPVLLFVPLCFAKPGYVLVLLLGTLSLAHHSLFSSASADELPVKILFPGNWADPTVTKVGDTYYLTSNNDHYTPSIMVFKSKDLKHWEPTVYTSPNQPQGPATDIINHNERLFIYGGGGRRVWAQYSDAPYTEWSERIRISPDVPLLIDAGHVVGRDGKRYLYVAKGEMVELSDDGLRVTTHPKRLYQGWEIPEDLAVECECLESPKFFWRGDYVYLVSAAGGTVGPSTSHMAIVARAKHPEGPWENAPNNPVIWTPSSEEPYWSKGHATFIEGPEGDWFAIYHGYVRNQRSWGRATLISPLKWTDDDWPMVADEWPEDWKDARVGFEWPMSDEFDGQELGIQWQAYETFDRDRYSFSNDALTVKAIGTAPGESNPITLNPKHLSYEVETELSLDANVEAGVIFFYNKIAWITFGVKDGQLVYTFRRGNGYPRREIDLPDASAKVRVKAINMNQDVIFYYAIDEGDWKKFERSNDIQGFQHNVFGSFSSVRPGIYAVGDGDARFEYFRYSQSD